MATSACPPRAALEAALLFLSKNPAGLGLLFRHILGDDRVTSLVRATGRRKAGVLDSSALLAEITVVDAKLRKRVVIALEAAWPQWLKRINLAASKQSNGLVVRCLHADDAEAWQELADFLALGVEAWPLPKLGSKELAQPHAATKPLPPPVSQSSEDTVTREEGLREQLRAARRDLATLQQQLGQERKEHAHAEQEAQTARSLAEQERKRASDWKQRLSSATEASERERALSEQQTQTERELHVQRQKFVMLQDERDDLRAVLADYDRFEESAAEQVPSFRDRPLTAPEQEIAAALAARKQAGAPAFHVLIVGGGPPQHRHQDKLREYADVLGFVTDWRMAEYQSWHRAMSGLQRDMQERYDALIILHWNRTTFTRRAREICDVGRAKPCLTCHYEGFTNLRESLQECLRQLLAGEQRA